MKYSGITAILLLSTFCVSCIAAGQTGSRESIFPLKNYSGDIVSRPNLLGDWGGRRNELAEDGITIEVELTQVFQGNARGGESTSGAWGYAGSSDYWLKFDTQRLGLWKGGLITLHGETVFGNSPLESVGSILPPNFDAVVPLPNKPGLTTFSEFYLQQSLSKELALIVGKIHPASLADKNVFASDERTQFLNTGFRANPTLFLYAPYTLMTAAALYIPTDRLEMAFFAADSNGGATRTGFETAFHSPRGVTIGTEWKFKVKPFGLTGHQRIGYCYSNKNYRKFTVSPITIFPPDVTSFEQQQGDTGVIWYNFDQYIYTEKDDPTQGVGIFGRFGYSDGNVNAIERFYSFGVGGKGIIDCRKNDTFGIGYYYMDLSDDLPEIFNYSSEQGVELYYNIEITKSMHFTPDLQWIIDPGASGSRDNAIVVGFRMQTNF